MVEQISIEGSNTIKKEEQKKKVRLPPAQMTPEQFEEKQKREEEKKKFQDNELIWKEIERSFSSVKKEFQVVYGFCITRPGLPTSTFVSYLIPSINEMEHLLTRLFSRLNNYDENEFKLNVAKYKSLKAIILLDIENARPTMQLMDPFDKLADKFIRLLNNYMEYIENKIAEIVIKKKRGG